MVFRMPAIAISLLALLLQAQAAKPPTFFKTPLTVQEMTNKQAVVNTSAGTFVIDLRPDLAPNHVGYFMKLRERGRLQRDDLPSRDQVRHRAGRRSAVEGSGEGEAVRHRRTRRAEGGAERARRRRAARSSAVLQPGRPDSAGAQFFVCVTDQAALDGKYTVFGRVSDGMDVVQKISETPARSGRACPAERIDDHVGRRSATRRRRSRCRSRQTRPRRLAKYRAVLDTTAGPITIELFGDKAPEHVRNFLRLASAGVYDGTAFHRVVKGFAIQTGALTSRGPLTEKQQKLVHNLQPEFNDTKHVKGIVSMARGDDPASATTSFFIVTGDGQLAGRQVHGVRPGRRRHGGRRSDRADAGERRDAGQQDRAQGRDEVVQAPLAQCIGADRPSWRQVSPASALSIPGQESSMTAAIHRLVVLGHRVGGRAVTSQPSFRTARWTIGPSGAGRTATACPPSAVC